MSNAPLRRMDLLDHYRPSRQGEAVLGPTVPNAQLSATFVLRRATGSPDDVTRIHDADMASVGEFARQHGLRVMGSHEKARSLTISGSAADFERAFHVELVDVERGRSQYRSYGRIPSLPPELREIVVGVFGLRARPLCPRARIHHAGSTKPFWTTQDLLQAYEFPRQHDGSGQVIALLEFGGGYDPADLEQFFAAQGLAVPQVVVKTIGGATNEPCTSDAVEMFLDVVEGRRDEASCDPAVLDAAQSTIEVTLDIELAGALAPGATLVVYMAPATEEGVYQALSAAVHDENPSANIITMSWGEPEPSVSEAQFNAVTQVLQDAVQRSITVCASSGDFGAYDDPETKNICVNFPASSPLVLACGGTTVMRFAASIEKETAWNCGLHGMTGATGGGVSERFPRPDWQSSHSLPNSPQGFAGRGLPDVAAAADPHNGCEILVKGIRCSAFGTSAVAPFWAALIARCNQSLGRKLGLLNPTLYQLAQSDPDAFRPIEEGNNGFYQATPGWNACAGLGAPRGSKLLSALQKLLRP